MTEKQLRRESWGRVHAYVASQPDARKTMLAFCACCRVTWDLVKLDCNRAALEASERFADGQLAVRTLKRHWNAMRFEPVVYAQWMLGAAGPAQGEGGFPNLSPQTDADATAVEAFEAVEAREQKSWSRAWIASAIDVFGHELNEFRFDREWATDTAVALARQMYDTRDFGAMPILADALQDAGCDCDVVLSHCRDATRAHVRGCWVVDLILGW